MPTLEELIAQKAELDQRISEIKQAERSNIISQVRTTIATFDLTVEELFGRGRQARRGSVAPKYRDPATGKTWSGRGRAPQWMEGKDRESFAI